MNWKKTFAVVRREYVERIRTKAFWIGTMLIPDPLLRLTSGSQIATSHKTGGERRIAVIDGTGALYEPLVADLAAQQEKARQNGVSAGSRNSWVLEHAGPATAI